MTEETKKAGSEAELKATPSNSSKQEPALLDKEDMSEFFKTAIIAILLALLIRTFLYEPFNIPSGSMLPTLEVGDYLFVSKPTYGYSKYSFPFGIANYEGRYGGSLPQRGDIAVFKLPSNPSIDYIKRVIGLPGDTIQVQNGRLYLNGKMVEREPVGLERVDKFGNYQVAMMEYIETLPGGVLHRIYEESDNGDLDNTPEYTVPEGHYFMMGDNRDNSQDSRVQALVGFVPIENIVGRADILFFSVDGSATMFEPWKWPFAVRYNRILNLIGPVRPKEESAS